MLILRYLIDQLRRLRMIACQVAGQRRLFAEIARNGAPSKANLVENAPSVGLRKRVEAYKAYAKTLGREPSQLSKAEKRQALWLAVLDPPVCEICGSFAFHAYLDVRETEPDGDWRCWEPDGPVKRRCIKHGYVPKVTYLDRHTSGGYNV